MFVKINNISNNRGTGNVTKFKRVITENPNIHSFTVESKNVADNKTFGLVKIKALDSNNDEIIGTSSKNHNISNDEDFPAPPSLPESAPPPICDKNCKL